LQTVIEYIKFTGYQGVELASIPSNTVHLADESHGYLSRLIQEAEGK
jgi:hypothetical protein